MSGPVSDSYDPEFQTGANAYAVSEGLQKVRGIISKKLGAELKNIVEVVQGPKGKSFSISLSERDLRLIRFAIDRSLESI